MVKASSPVLPLDLSLLRPGMRLAVGLSGGADSTALLCALASRREELGLALHVAHLHHGLRGAEADGDLAFCQELAAELDLPFHSERVDVAAVARAEGETIEEAARRLRYQWFGDLLTRIPLHAVATAHTRDDQAETVLAKLLRGAWTEGIAGIHPVVALPGGQALRPLLAVSRREIEEYLQAIGREWREDSSNAETLYTRNRIRHELLPQLEGWNPQIRKRLTFMAELARAEEAYFEGELARLLPQLLLPGRPARGGGRASGAGEELAVDLARLAAQPVALQRRLLRAAAARLGPALSFEATEELRSLALGGRAGQRRELEGRLRAERSHRELRLSLAVSEPDPGSAPALSFPVPGELRALAYGLHIKVDADTPATALLRAWRPGDRVRQRYSSGPRKVKEVLERLRVSGAERVNWPVLDWGGRIVWMRGVELEPEPGVRVQVEPLACDPV